MAIALQNTPLWLDIEDILKGTDPIPVYRYTVQVHTTEKDYDAIQVLSVDISRDYVNKYGDEIALSFQLPRAVYLKDFYPYRHNLEISLSRELLAAEGGYPSAASGVETKRYKAIFLAQANYHPVGGSDHQLDEFTLNNQVPVDVHVQLLDRTLEPLRLKTVSGTFSNVKREALIQSILGGETNKIKVDGKAPLDGFDMPEPDNKEPISQIIFPNNTPVLSVPSFIQERHTGVYSSGIGNYYQSYQGKNLWFVYPLFDVERLTENKPKLIVYSVTGHQFSGMDRTFLLKDHNLHVLASDAKRYVDDGEAGQMSSGSGFRQANADALFNAPVSAQNGEAIAARAKLNTEVSIQNRSDGFNYAPVSTRGVSNNNYAEYSRQIMKNVARIDFIWHNARYDLLYPGMPCKYLYIDNNEVKTVRGVVAHHHTLITKGATSAGVKATDIKYAQSTYVSLIVERSSDALA